MRESSGPATGDVDAGASVAPPEGFAPLGHRSAFGGLIGPVLRKDTPDGPIFGLRIEKKHINMGGIAHGGLLATFADIVLGQFESRDYTRTAVTARMVTDFIGPARLGDWIEAETRVTRETRSLVFPDARVTCRGHVLLNASAVFKILRRRRTGGDT